MPSAKRLQASFPDVIAVEVAGAPLTIALRRSSTARRLSLRLPPGDAEPVLTMPAHASLRAAERFLRSNERWLQEQLSRRQPGIPFAHGSVIPLRGMPTRIVHQPLSRGTPQLCADEAGAVLTAGGAAEHLHRRVADTLRRWARDDVKAAVSRHTAKIGCRAAGLCIKDTRSQWGSCTAAGVLSFSWRLVLAPPEVLDYVAAHEVAHLIELNHSDHFWELTRALCPNMDQPMRWLKQNGRALHAVGTTPARTSIAEVTTFPGRRSTGLR